MGMMGGGGADVTLEYILYDNKMSKLFVEFIIKAHAEDNLTFWLEVELFKRIKADDHATLHSIGQRIYNTYLQAGSVREVNLDKKYKDIIKQKIESNVWDVTLFNRAHQRIHHILSSDCVLIFAEKFIGPNAAEQNIRAEQTKADTSSRNTLLKKLAEYRELQQRERRETKLCKCISWKDFWSPSERPVMVVGQV